MENCFICKGKSGDGVYKCTVKECHRYYHTACVLKCGLTRRILRDTFICPIHTCAGCKVYDFTDSIVLGCVNCPKSYHKHCLPKDCTILAPDQFVCTEHTLVEPRKETFEDVVVLNRDSTLSVKTLDGTNLAVKMVDTTSAVEMLNAISPVETLDGNSAGFTHGTNLAGMNANSTSAEMNKDSTSAGMSKNSTSARWTKISTLAKLSPETALSLESALPGLSRDSTLAECVQDTASVGLTKDSVAVKVAKDTKIANDSDAVKADIDCGALKVVEEPMVEQTDLTEAKPTDLKLDQAGMKEADHLKDGSGSGSGLKKEAPVVVQNVKDGKGNAQTGQAMVNDVVDGKGGGELRRKLIMIKNAHGIVTEFVDAESVVMKEMPVDGEHKEDDVQWVQCDKCKKWRTIPTNVQFSSLPEHWYCQLNTWSAEYAFCDAPEQVIKSNIKSPNEVKGKPLGEKKNSGRKRKLKQLQWVQCENAKCGKWRSAPATVNVGALPEKWFCSMNTWNLALNNCDIPNPAEEESFIKKKGRAPSFKGRQKKGRNSFSSADGRKRNASPKNPHMEAKHLGRPTAKNTPGKHVWQWVQCERCEKWRRLSSNIDISSISESWYCVMNTWDSGRAHCSADQEDDHDGSSEPSSTSAIASVWAGLNCSRRDKSKLSYRDMIFATNGFIKKVYTETALPWTDANGKLHYRDDQYRDSIFYCDPEATKKRKVTQVQPAVENELNVQDISVLEDTILTKLTVRSYSMMQLAVEIQLECDRMRQSNLNAAPYYSYQVIQTTLNELKSRGILERANPKSKKNGENIVSDEPLYRRKLKKPLKGWKPWKMADLNKCPLRVDWGPNTNVAQYS